MDLDRVVLPDGTERAIKTRLMAVDNARERVDQTGKVVGIRATSTMGHRAAGIARNLFIWDPLIQLVLVASTTATIRFPEAEIHFDAGTEFLVQLVEPLTVEQEWPWQPAHVAANAAEQEDLRKLVRGMTWRTYKKDTPKASDVVNVIFLGEPEWIERAFDAAGWVHADPLSKKTGWMTFRSVAELKEYRNAPMSPQTLDELPPAYQLSKALNNYSKRHHLRLWLLDEEWKGRPVFAAASTQDIAITFSFKNRRLIHLIDRNLDNERAKVVNDMVYTGCIDAAELMPRGWVPNTLTNATREHLQTDGSVAILELNPCRSPRTAPRIGEKAVYRPPTHQRGPRQFLLTVGSDFTFNNPAIQLGHGARWLWHKMRGKDNDRKQPERTALLSPSPRPPPSSPETEP
jgi:hypothetical protein